MPRQFPPESRQRVLRMLEESPPDHQTGYAAIRHVADKLEVGPESLRKWRRKSEVDSGARPGVTSTEAAEIRRLKKEIERLIDSRDGLGAENLKLVCRIFEVGHQRHVRALSLGARTHVYAAARQVAMRSPSWG